MVYFQGHTKGMVLNKTNANNLSNLYGPESDGWIGKPMMLVSTFVDFQGQSTPALRLHPPQVQAIPQQAFTQPGGQPGPGQPIQTGTPPPPVTQTYSEINPPPAGDDDMPF